MSIYNFPNLEICKFDSLSVCHRDNNIPKLSTGWATRSALRGRHTDMLDIYYIYIYIYVARWKYYIVVCLFTTCAALVGVWVCLLVVPIIEAPRFWRNKGTHAIFRGANSKDHGRTTPMESGICGGPGPLENPFKTPWFSILETFPHRFWSIPVSHRPFRQKKGCWPQKSKQQVRAKTHWLEWCSTLLWELMTWQPQSFTAMPLDKSD